MKKSGVTFIFVLLMMLGAAGCWIREAGPCIGYGCPAFAPTATQAPRQSAKNAPSHKAFWRKAQAQNDVAPQAPAKSGQ